MSTIRIVAYDAGAVRSGGAELLDAAGLKWVDVENPDEATMNMLGERYGLHRLVIEDCLHRDQRPKLEEYPGHQFIVLQGFTGAPNDLVMHEWHFVLGDAWLVTVHESGHEAIAAVRTRIMLDAATTIGRGCDFIAYLLTDALADHNFPLLDAFSDCIESLEERIFSESPSKAMMHDAFELKRSLVTVRRVLSPQRDVVSLLARNGVTHVQERTTLYFRDVYDHLMRINEQIDSARDLVGNAVDAYLSVVANRTSDISKQLTVFASIFMPLSFVVGFFGQNFDGINGPGFLVAALVLMGLIPAVMIGWFKHKEWM